MSSKVYHGGEHDTYHSYLPLQLCATAALAVTAVNAAAPLNAELIEDAGADRLDVWAFVLASTGLSFTVRLVQFKPGTVAPVTVADIVRQLEAAGGGNQTAVSAAESWPPLTTANYPELVCHPQSPVSFTILPNCPIALFLAYEASVRYVLARYSFYGSK